MFADLLTGRAGLATATPADTVETLVTAIMLQGARLDAVVAEGRVGGDARGMKAIVEAGVGNVVYVITAAQAFEAARQLRAHHQAHALPGLTAAAGKLFLAWEQAGDRFAAYQRRGAH